jgi:hypothetical protein
MAAGTLNLTIEQGAYFEADLALTDNETVPSPIDLTGVTVRAQIREKTSSSTIAASFTCVVTDDVGGLINISMSATTTAAIAAAVQPTAGTKTNRLYLWDLELVYSATKVIRLLQGSVTLSPEATR